jgi:hypothetical protein
MAEEGPVGQWKVINPEVDPSSMGAASRTVFSPRRTISGCGKDVSSTFQEKTAVNCHQIPAHVQRWTVIGRGGRDDCRNGSVKSCSSPLLMGLISRVCDCRDGRCLPYITRWATTGQLNEAVPVRDVREFGDRLGFGEGRRGKKGKASEAFCKKMIRTSFVYPTKCALILIQYMHSVLPIFYVNKVILIISKNYH